MAKASKNSTPPQELSKDCGWLEYMSQEAMRLFPDKESWRKRLIYSLYASLDEKDKKGREPIDTMQFCRTYKIPYNTLLYTAKKYEDVGKAYADFKLHLAANRRIGAAYKELDKDVIFKDQHRYDPEQHEINKYHAELQAQARKDAEQTGDVIINIPPMPTTNKVKEKKK